jgi:hypothetical protein
LGLAFLVTGDVGAGPVDEGLESLGAVVVHGARPRRLMVSVRSRGGDGSGM